MLAAVDDQDGDGLDEVLTCVRLDSWRNQLRMYKGTDNGSSAIVQFGRVDTSTFDHFWDSPQSAYPLGDIDGHLAYNRWRSLLDHA